MPKSLAEMRQSPAVGLPERTKPLCLAQPLVAKAQSLTEERESIQVESVRDEDGNHNDGPPRRVGEGPNPRIAEIGVELEALWDEMREHTGELLLRGVTGGDWRRWVQAHPPRDPETAEGKIDQQVAYGYCDANALVDDLGKYAAAWNGDPLGEGDWDFIANRAAPGDLKEVARTVVQMHEGEGVRAPKASRKPSSGNPPSVIDSDSLAT